MRHRSSSWLHMLSIAALLGAIPDCGGGTLPPDDASADAIAIDAGFDALQHDASTTDAVTDSPVDDAPWDVPTSDTPSAMPAAIVFQCSGLNGGICTMDRDGSSRQMILAVGRVPDINAAGDILFHDDSYNVQMRSLDATVTPFGAGSSARWAPNGNVVFQCSGLGGGICTVHADGTSRQMISSTGRSPDRNAAGEVLFHDASYTVQLRHAGGTITALGAGAFPTWAPGGGIVFQCSGTGGGICTMNADGTGRHMLSAMGRSPARNAAGEILYHDDNYNVQLRHADGTVISLGAGAFARWAP